MWISDCVSGEVARRRTAPCRANYCLAGCQTICFGYRLVIFFRCCVHSLLQRRVVTNEIGWIFYSALGVFSIFYCRPDCDNAVANFNQWSGLGPVVAAPTGFLSQMGAALWRMVLDCGLFIFCGFDKQRQPQKCKFFKHETGHRTVARRRHACACSSACWLADCVVASSAGFTQSAQ